MRKKMLAVLFVTVLCVGAASAQFGSGIVYDPTNYHNALLRYYQLQQHLAQLQKTYTQTVTAYNLALQMSRNLHNMPARYRAQFSNWRNVTASNTYGNTSGWLGGVNADLNTINGYLRATTQLGLYNQSALANMPDQEQARVKSQYASVELADGANMNALSTIGTIRCWFYSCDKWSVVNEKVHCSCELPVNGAFVDPSVLPGTAQARADHSHAKRSRSHRSHGL